MPFPNSEFVQSGRFTNVEEIGQGAYGKVYRARDNMGRDVAVKEVLPSSEAVGEARARFEKESRIQARLEHPNIIRVYHLEKDSATDEWYLVCEFANGGSLADYLEQHGKLSEELAIKIALDISNALAEVWEGGIVHRDIKPSNILLARNANGEITARLGDFGAAQDQQSTRTTMFQGSSHPGTPMYMAPEQSNSANILDARADIYALGITLWEMLTTQDYKLLAQTEEPNLRKYNPDASGRVAKVIRAAVQNDPQQRYQTPADMTQDLKSVQQGKEPRIAMKSKKSTPQEGYYARRKWLWIVPVLIVLLLLGGGAYVLFGSGGNLPFVAQTPTATAIPPTAVPPTVVPPTATITATPEPPTVTVTPANICAVPDVVGMDQSAAAVLLTGAGLDPIRSPQFNADVPEGAVIAQDPEAGTRLDPCAGEVTFVFSTGPEPTTTALPTEETADTPEPADIPEPTEAPEPADGAFATFRDDFDTTLRPEWRVASSGLSIRQGNLVGDRGTIVYDQEGSDYVIRTRVQGNGRFGIMFRRTPNLNEGYVFQCDGGNCRWYTVTDGNNFNAISSEVPRRAAFGTEEFHDLTLEIRGRDFTALVDGAHFSSVTDETYTSGVVGLYSNRGYGNEVAFDYFELAPLP